MRMNSAMITPNQTNRSLRISLGLLTLMAGGCGSESHSLTLENRETNTTRGIVITCLESEPRHLLQPKAFELLLPLHDHEDARLSGTFKNWTSLNKPETVAVQVTAVPFHSPRSPETNYYRYDFSTESHDISIWTAQTGSASLRSRSNGALVMNMTCTRK